MKTPLRTVVPMALASLAAFPSLRAGSFIDNFDSGLPAGSTVGGSAFIDGTGGFTGGALKVTTSLNGLQGGYVIDDLDGGGAVNSFTVTFKARIGGGTPTPADGWSFCVASDLPVGGTWSEEGVGTGLMVCFDTYDNTDGNPLNGVGEAPAITVRWNGALVTEVFPTLAQLITGDGTPPTPNWADVVVKMDNDGSLDVSFDGVAFVTDLFTPYNPISGALFGFGARTGGLNANHFIDDLSITTTTGGLKAGIVHQPQSSIFLSGSPARFYVLLGNDAAALGYQWERRAPGGGAFVPIGGATTRDLVTAPVTPADNGATYRLAITDADGITYSNEATLTVDTLTEPVFPYAQNFDGGAILPGSIAYPTAVGDVGGFLSLTTNANDQSGGFVIDDLNAGAAISSIFATFDIRMGEATSLTAEGAPLPADGLSFNWGQEMVAGTIPGAEDGGGNGLRLSFDVYDNTDGNPYNGAGEGPSLDVSWGTTLLSKVPVTPAEFDTALGFQHVAVSLASTGFLSVAVNGRLYFKDVVVPGWSAMPGAQFGFYARTGGANQKHEIDNVRIRTEVYAGDVQITDHPDNFVGLTGGTATFTVGANYSVPPATVQWQRKGPLDAGFSNIGGATSSTYITPSLTPSDNGALYRAVVSLTPTNTATSQDGTLTVVDINNPPSADVILTFNTDLSNSGTAAGVVPVLAGSAALATPGGVGDSGFLSVTENGPSLTGALIVENFSGPTAQGSMVASFFVHLTGGGVVNLIPADGFSFNWGADVPATTVGGFGAEEGAGTGLIVSFDTYDNVDANPDNGVGEAPSIAIKYGGLVIADKLLTRTVMQPLDWAPIGIRVENDGTVDVAFNGEVIHHNVQIPGWTGLANGRFNLAGRTGGASETHWFDELTINTTNYVGPINFTQQPASSAGFLGSTVTFTAQVNDPGQTTWQWESAPAGSPTFTPIGGATTNSYTTPALTLADANRQFRVKAQGATPANLLTSTIAILSVEDPNLPAPTAILNFDDPTTLTYGLAGTALEDNVSGGGVNGSGFASLTIPAEGQIGNLAVDDFSGGALVTSMIASWQMRIGGGSVPPADGVSFNWAPDVSLATIPSEEGSGSGLTVCFDTYDNGLPDVIGIAIRWQGSQLAEKPLPVATFLSDPDYFPTVVKVDADGTADVWYNNIIIFNNIPLPGWAGVSGANFVWGARTGGANENAFLDDINLYTTTGTAPAGGINIQVVGTNIVITYTGTLQSSTSMGLGSWAPVGGATSPHQIPLPVTGALFFRSVTP